VSNLIIGSHAVHNKINNVSLVRNLTVILLLVGKPDVTKLQLPSKGSLACWKSLDHQDDGIIIMYY